MGQQIPCDPDDGQIKLLLFYYLSPKYRTGWIG